MIIRPPKPPADEDLDAAVTVRLTRGEKVALRARAKRLGTSMSAEGRAAIAARLAGSSRGVAD